MASRSHVAGIALGLLLLLGALAVSRPGVPSPEKGDPAVAPTAATSPELRVRARAPSLPPVFRDRPLPRAFGGVEEAEGDLQRVGDDMPVKAIRITVVYPEGDPVNEEVWVKACGRPMPLTTGETALFLPVKHMSCPIAAWRMDGMLVARSNEVDLDLRTPGDEDIELVLPRERQAGLGVQIQEHEAGIEVVGVVPGSPADRMGLEPGDLITEVDGLPSASLELDEFIQTMTGPEGTEVEFRVSVAGDTAEVPLVLERAVIERT